jgi:XRCC1 N terminal domain
MNSSAHRPLRKQLLRRSARTLEPSHLQEIDLHAQATIHYSSEDPAHPIEHMLDGSSGTGSSCWQSAHANVTEEILLEFDEPQHISHVAFEVEEGAATRTQEVRAEFSSDGGQTYRGAFVQSYNFSPTGSTYECENLSLDLRSVTHFRLIVVPNKDGAGRATLTSLRLFA